MTGLYGGSTDRVGLSLGNGGEWFALPSIPGSCGRKWIQQREVIMEQTILDYGPPPLTEGAADAALDAIDFIAATVRGFDAIDVTDVLRPLWRAHLASLFSHLPPETRMWFANAPGLLIRSEERPVGK